MTDLNDDSEETKLDTDIQNIEEQLENLNHPEELQLNNGINDDMLKNMVDKMKTMPKSEEEWKKKQQDSVEAADFIS